MDNMMENTTTPMSTMIEERQLGTTFHILENGQVMQKVIDRTFIEETCIGMEKQYQSLELANHIIYQWNRFDTTQNKYVVDTKNTTAIIIDGKSYVPIEGKVEVMKQLIVEPEADEEIATLYEAVIVLDNRITTLESK